VLGCVAFASECQVMVLRQTTLPHHGASPGQVHFGQTVTLAAAGWARPSAGSAVYHGVTRSNPAASAVVPTGSAQSPEAMVASEDSSLLGSLRQLGHRRAIRREAAGASARTLELLEALSCPSRTVEGADVG